MEVFRAEENGIPEIYIPCMIGSGVPDREGGDPSFFTISGKLDRSWFLIPYCFIIGL